MSRELERDIKETLYTIKKSLEMTNISFVELFKLFAVLLNEIEEIKELKCMKK